MPMALVSGKRMVVTPIDFRNEMTACTCSVPAFHSIPA
jgi:hypothetical protein